MLKQYPYNNTLTLDWVQRAIVQFLVDVDKPLVSEDMAHPLSKDNEGITLKQFKLTISMHPAMNDSTVFLCRNYLVNLRGKNSRLFFEVKKIYIIYLILCQMN